MKHICLLSILLLCCISSRLAAQEIWVDEDFSSDEWTREFEDAGMTNPGTGVVEISAAYVNHLFKKGEYGGIPGEQGYRIAKAYWSGAFIENPTKGIDGREITHAVRMTNAAEDSYIELPALKNAGKIFIYVRNSNSNTATRFDLQKQAPSGSGWEDITSFSAVGANQLTESLDELHSYELNTDQPVKLRIYRNKLDRNINIFRIKIEKYGVDNAIQSATLDATDVWCDGKTIHLASLLKDSQLYLYDLSGRKILQSPVDSNLFTLPDALNKGIYILQIFSNEGSVSKKVVVR